MRWGHMGQVLWLSALLWPMLRVGKSKPANPMWRAEGREDTWTVGDEWRGCSGCGHVEVSGGTVIGTLRVEDWYIYIYILSICMARKEMWHYNRGLVLCLDSCACTHQASSRESFYLLKIGRLHFLIFQRKISCNDVTTTKYKDCEAHFVIFD